MAVLVDANVLLRRTQPNHDHHRAAVESVAKLLERGETVVFTAQNIYEFWNVLTRPIASNGLGFSTAQAQAEIEKIETVLTLLPDCQPHTLSGRSSLPNMPCKASKSTIRGLSPA